MKTLKTVLSINLLVIIGFLSVQAQTKTSLRFDESRKSTIGQTLFCDRDSNCGLRQNEKIKTATINGLGTRISVSRSAKGFYLVVDKNANNRLSDDRQILLAPGSSIRVKIKKKLPSGGSLFLPFEISHSAYEKNAVAIDDFSVTPHYSGTGILKYKNCSSKIALSDMNYSGSFTPLDADRGTNLGIDVNNDGKFWGKEEYRRTNEIIEFCGQNFLVATLNNRNLILTPTNLKIAKLGEVVPEFSFALLNGKILSSDKLKGKNYVMDFWASWCVPCVKNLPQIKSLKTDFESKLTVVSVNVDKSSKKNLAKKIIDEYQLFDFSVIRGQGDNDFLWKSFGGANQNRLTIPLYVLVDRFGVVRYADNGGDDLKELRAILAQVLNN